MTKILMVCLGNICRSPMAEAVLQGMMENENKSNVEVISRGTASWEMGKTPHNGTIKELAKHGIGVGDKRAQVLSQKDVTEADLILAMDESNYEDIIAQYPNESEKVHLILEKGHSKLKGVPDPWYSGDFSGTYELIYDALKEWKKEI